MKKYFTLLILSVLFLLTSCTTTNTNQIKLPKLDGLTREEIKEKLDGLDLEYVFYFDNSVYHEDKNLFIRYGNGLTGGSFVDKGTFIRIYTTQLELTYKVSNTFTIDFEYEGKSFILDGVGKVELISTTDGDTARFKDPITGEEFRLRFLGIDTPETWGQQDPWGKAASNFCKEKLTKAKEIVLEAEGARTEGYGRYLGWVWLDGVLYNLEVVEEAYSNSTCSSDSKYYEYFIDVDIQVQRTGRRFFGEIDPNYDYENKKFK